MEFVGKIKNSELLTEVFGRWPSFHDSEVVEIILSRDKYSSEYGPTLRAALYVFDMTSEIDEKGYYVLKNKSIVWIQFLEVVELSLDDFNYQNVLWGLTIIDVSGDQLERVKFEVSFDSSFGIDAKFKCFAIEVESVEPYKPEESQV